MQRLCKNEMQKIIMRIFFRFLKIATHNNLYYTIFNYELGANLRFDFII